MFIRFVLGACCSDFIWGGRDCWICSVVIVWCCGFVLVSLWVFLFTPVALLDYFAG